MSQSNYILPLGIQDKLLCPHAALAMDSCDAAHPLFRPASKAVKQWIEEHQIKIKICKGNFILLIILHSIYKFMTPGPRTLRSGTHVFAIDRQ